MAVGSLAFRCILRGPRTAATFNAEWPRPRPRQGRLGPDGACRQGSDQAAAGSPIEGTPRQSNVRPDRHIACSTTAIVLASAMAARLKPSRFCSDKPQARSELSVRTRVSRVVAASEKRARR